MSELLTDRTPRVAAARKLLRRAAREDTGRFLVEGVRPVRDAIAWAEHDDEPTRVHDLFATEAVAAREPDLLHRAERAGVRVARVTEKAAAGLSDTVTPQGIAVVCRQVTVPVDEALRGAGLVTVLVGVSDPGNAGTVVRTSDAAGADAVVLAGDTVDPHNPKCVRASMGSLLHVAVARVRDVPGLLRTLRDAGLTLLGADGYGDTVLDDGTDELLARPTAWLFGSEAHGLPEDVRTDHRVRVPIHGRAESLNLATAAAVCLYASARVRHRTP